MFINHLTVNFHWLYCYRSHHRWYIDILMLGKGIFSEGMDPQLLCTHSVAISDTFQMDFIWFNPNPERKFWSHWRNLFLNFSWLLLCFQPFGIEFGNRSVCICRYITQISAPDLHFKKIRSQSSHIYRYVKKYICSRCT